jgi:hypothetical protein
MDIEEGIPSAAPRTTIGERVPHHGLVRVIEKLLG